MPCLYKVLGSVSVPHEYRNTSYAEFGGLLLSEDINGITFEDILLNLFVLLEHIAAIELSKENVSFFFFMHIIWMRVSLSSTLSLQLKFNSIKF